MYADGVESSNIVGYSTVSSVTAGKFVALAVQFEEVQGGSIAVKDVITVGAIAGSPALSDAADQMWKWDTENAAWVKYFYRSGRGIAADQIGWYRSDDLTAITTDVVDAGETIFFRRGSGMSATSLTMAGGVKLFTATKEYAVTSGKFSFMGYPWPMNMPVASISNYYEGSVAGSPALADAADQIWRWDTANATWIKYYYRSGRGVDATKVGWTKNGEDAITTESIPAGEGFFFRRGSGAAALSIKFVQ